MLQWINLNYIFIDLLVAYIYNKFILETSKSFILLDVIIKFNIIKRKQKYKN